MSRTREPDPDSAAAAPPATPSATTTNRATYNALWPQLSDFIRLNPGARHRRRHVFAWLDALRFESLLDVGCGNAELLRLIDVRYPGRTLSGVDLSETVVAHNQAAVPRMRFAVANIEAHDLPGAAVDVIVCCEVLEHLDQPEAALVRIAAALPAGGHAIITTPTGTVHATERHFGHVRHPRPQELVQQAQRAGFDVVDLRVWGWPTYAFTKWVTNLDPQRALQRFAGDKPYGLLEKGVSLSLWLANFANFERSPLGVQLFALLKKR